MQTRSTTRYQKLVKLMNTCNALQEAAYGWSFTIKDPDIGFWGLHESFSLLAMYIDQDDPDEYNEHAKFLYDYVKDEITVLQEVDDKEKYKDVLEQLNIFMQDVAFLLVTKK